MTVIRPTFERRLSTGITMTGFVVALLIGSVGTVLRYLGILPAMPIGVALTLSGIVGLLLFILFFHRGREGRRHVLSLAVGAALGGIAVTASLANPLADQAVYGIASFFLTTMLLERVALNQADSARTKTVDQFIRAVEKLPFTETLHVEPLGSVIDLAFDTRTPTLVALYLNDSFYQYGRAPRGDAYRLLRGLKLPFTDTRLKLETIEDWRSAAIIVHARQAPTVRELKRALDEVRVLPRRLELSAQVIDAAGYDEGLRLLRSDMPDEYLNALAPTA